jgi:hypothetical protein
MNHLEKLIHSAIGNFPFIRIPLVYSYQKILSLVPTKNYQIDKTIEFPGFFYGFHDKCPWSYNDSYILAHKFDLNIPINKVEKFPIGIGVFKQNSKDFSNFTIISSSTAWNWQQGSSAQWIGDKDIIIFNDFMDNKCVSKIISVNGKIKDILPFHIANTTKDGTYAFTYSFARLGHGMPGYGYNFKAKLNEIELSNKTLSIMNLESGEKKTFFDIDSFARLRSKGKMEGSFGFFSHCISSPNSKRFVFLYRWIDRYSRLNTRMYSVGIDGSKLFKFPIEDCSHIAWFDQNNILAYCKPKKANFHYYLIKDLDGRIKKIMDSQILSDGHPQVSKDCRYMLTDTYPDRFRNQFLKIFDIKSKKEIILTRYRIPFQYRLERRCDFHPRWNRSNNMICFDSSHNGVRSLCILDNPLF